jgi:NTP pyrophosphatase (non-canonical NTP hydrolase)
MDKKVTLVELKKRVQQFCEERVWDQYHNPKDLAIGVITEASELLEHFRFLTDEQSVRLISDPQKRQEIEEEIADVLFFILRFAQRFDIDLDDSLKKKIEKNAEMYPVEEWKGRNSE